MSSSSRSVTSIPVSMSVRERIMADVAGPRDDALVFAASSIINEVMAQAYNGVVVVREVRTDTGTYTLRGSRAFGPNGAHPAVLVFAQRPADPGRELIEHRLRHRFRLTRKEIGVAWLLAEYKSNEEIATRLSISRHTARHHTQSVLGKLGVKSRRDVAEVMRSS